MVGRTLAHYKILRSLGKGGMGEVYAAQDTRLRRTVAIKVLPSEVSDDPRRLLRFEREARAVAALNHPGIVTIYSVEKADGVRFLTMELVDGKPLQRLIPSGGLPLEKIFALAVPLADALSAAHAKGIVHRDLKPGNIMVTADGGVKILDFGLARLRGEQIADAGPDDATELLTQAGQVVGTVPYMSPEQVNGEVADERSDIFSMGIILHEVVCGRRVFSGATAAEVSSSILRDEPPPVSDSRPELPHHLSRIIALCLAKDPGRRYQSAIDLRNELEVLQREVSQGVARPSTLSGELPVVGRRAPWRRLLPAAGAVAALALLAAVGWSYLARGPAGEPGIDSIAVMPLENLTGDPDQAYLGDGISAGLITQLGELAALFVVGRTETWKLRDKELAAREIGGRLGAEAVLEGTVRREGGGLLIGVELTDTVSGEMVWSATVMGERERLFELQREVARDLSRFLSVPQSAKERRRLARNPTRSRRAYALYLQGQQFLEAVDNPRNARFAAEVFQQAVNLDPKFALAHVGLSEAWWKSHQAGRDPAMLERAEAEAERALEIDPDLPSALVALARVYRTSGRYAESIAELRPLLERHPRPSEAYRELAASYEEAGELEAAERALEAAIALGGEDWSGWNALGGFLSRQGQSGQAQEAFEKAASLAPESITWPAQNLLALALSRGDFESVIAWYEKLGDLSLDARQASNVGTAYFFAGRLEEAERLYRQAVRLAPGDPGLQGNLGDVLVRLGREVEASVAYASAYQKTLRALESFPNDNQTRLLGALYAAKSDACDEAITSAARLEVDLPKTADNAHYLAWIYSLCDRRAEALGALRAAIERGVATELLRNEDEFRSLRGDAEFERLVGTSPADPTSP